ncbi:MAG: hypothetical protein ACFNQD_05500, partial [Prevotella intermedia]
YFSVQVVCHNILVINVLENLLFCIPKAAVLQRKTAAFATPNQNYHFLVEISLQDKGVYPSLFLLHVVLPAEFQDLPKRFP